MYYFFPWFPNSDIVNFQIRGLCAWKSPLVYIFWSRPNSFQTTGDQYVSDFDAVLHSVLLLTRHEHRVSADTLSSLLSELLTLAPWQVRRNAVLWPGSDIFAIMLTQTQSDATNMFTYDTHDQLGNAQSQGRESTRELQRNKLL
jgi:hypothetical protein